MYSLDLFIRIASYYLRGEVQHEKTPPRRMVVTAERCLEQKCLASCKTLTTNAEDLDLHD